MYGWFRLSIKGSPFAISINHIQLRKSVIIKCRGWWGRLSAPGQGCHDMSCDVSCPITWHIICHALLASLSSNIITHNQLFYDGKIIFIQQWNFTTNKMNNMCDEHHFNDLLNAALWIQIAEGRAQSDLCEKLW